MVLIHEENKSDLHLIMEAINTEMDQSGSLLGYRLMWIRLRTKYQVNVRRDTVMMLLSVMDPIGTYYLVCVLTNSLEVFST